MARHNKNSNRKKELKDKNISKLVNFLKSMGVKNLKSFL